MCVCVYGIKIFACSLEKSVYMGVSENGGTPKSSNLIGFSNINHPFWGITFFGNTHIYNMFIIKIVYICTSPFSSGMYFLLLPGDEVPCKGISLFIDFFIIENTDK